MFLAVLRHHASQTGRRAQERLSIRKSAGHPQMNRLFHMCRRDMHQLSLEYLPWGPARLNTRFTNMKKPTSPRSTIREHRPVLPAGYQPECLLGYPGAPLQGCLRGFLPRRPGGHLPEYLRMLQPTLMMTMISLIDQRQWIVMKIDR